MTGSTNQDLLGLAQAGSDTDVVLVADHQTAGRGRQGRHFVDEPGRSLLFSVLIRPRTTALGLIPLVAGLAVIEGIAQACGVVCDLKWPNDVLASADRGPGGSGAKVAGILTELTATQTGPAVVIGCGINVAFPDGPPPELAGLAIDLASLGPTAPLDRPQLLRAILDRLGPALDELDNGGNEALVAAYRTRCVSLGRRVRLDTPGGEVAGVAVDIDPGGGLIVDDGTTRRVVVAGDAHHIPD